MINLSELLKEFEKAMSAAAFAEEGEHATARQIMENFGKTNKKVLLGTDELELDSRVIKYTLKLCQRMEGGLEILHVNPASKGESGRPDKEKLPAGRSQKYIQEKMLGNGIVYQPVWSEKKLLEEIKDYVASRRHIISVVLRSSDYALNSSDRRIKSREVSTLLQKIQCPVVFWEDRPESAR